MNKGNMRSYGNRSDRDRFSRTSSPDRPQSSSYRQDMSRNQRNENYRPDYRGDRRRGSPDSWNNDRRNRDRDRGHFNEFGNWNSSRNSSRGDDRDNGWENRPHNSQRVEHRQQNWDRPNHGNYRGNRDYPQNWSSDYQQRDKRNFNQRNEYHPRRSPSPPRYDRGGRGNYDGDRESDQNSEHRYGDNRSESGRSGPSERFQQRDNYWDRENDDQWDEQYGGESSRRHFQDRDERGFNEEEDRNGRRSSGPPRHNQFDRRRNRDNYEPRWDSRPESRNSRMDQKQEERDAGRSKNNFCEDDEEEKYKRLYDPNRQKDGLWINFQLHPANRKWQTGQRSSNAVGTSQHSPSSQPEQGTTKSVTKDDPCEEKTEKEPYRVWRQRHNEMHAERKKNFEHYMELCKITDMERGIVYSDEDVESERDEEELERGYEEQKRLRDEENRLREEEKELERDLAQQKVKEQICSRSSGGRYRKSKIEVTDYSVPAWAIGKNFKDEVWKEPLGPQYENLLTRKEALEKKRRLDDWLVEIRVGLEKALHPRGDLNAVPIERPAY